MASVSFSISPSTQAKSLPPFRSRARRNVRAVSVSSLMDDSQSSSQQLNLSILRFTLGIPGFDESYLPSWYEFCFCCDLLSGHGFGEVRLDMIGDEVPEPPTNTVEEEHGSESDSSEKTIFFGVVAAGFTPGFWGLFGILIFKKTWRVAYFRFAEEATDKVYVAVAVKVHKFKRRMRSG